MRKNILGLLLAFSLINLPAYIFSSGVKEINSDNFLSLGIGLFIVVVGFIVLGKIKPFTWIRKVYIFGLIIAFIGNGVSFFLLVKLNQLDSEVGAIKDLSITTSLKDIKPDVFYKLETDVIPEFNFKGEYHKQTRKASKYFDHYHVFPILNGSDSIRYFFACRTNNGMLGITLEKFKEILSGGNRIIKRVDEKYYRLAVSDFKKMNQLAVSDKAQVFIVIDPERMFAFIYEYFIIVLFGANGLFVFGLLLANLKINKDEKLDIP